MPPPRKVNLLPADLRDWLKEELITRGFADYEEVTEILNFRLEEQGLELRLGKSAVHAYGQEYAEFSKYQAEASAWAQDWMKNNGLEEEAQRHNVLFQMITTLAFKAMAAQMTKKGDEINPQDLQSVGRMLKDIMSSAGMRQKMLADEAKRIAQDAREQAQAEMAERVEEAVGEAGLSEEHAKFFRNKVLGLRE